MVERYDLLRNDQCVQLESGDFFLSLENHFPPHLSEPPHEYPGGAASTAQSCQAVFAPHHQQRQLNAARLFKAPAPCPLSSP